jgi:hypothetical protein
MTAQESLILLNKIKNDYKRYWGYNNETIKQLQVLIEQIRTGESLEIQKEIK